LPLISSSISYYTVLYIAGSVVGFVGLVYIGLHFMPVIEPPSYVLKRVIG
jgi:hypothetical protein